ncbi:uncharacterized protein LOC106654314 [Trichogramma pretiosum]|uniref:uncharacterized protein LOC106654314 n=1 Tax=Trichogramma pretiosum TaxID=7493 RepID=UPI0006C97812|nr:uncharacterized protein LOC106654314 [Trichogramma pretiosum]
MADSRTFIMYFNVNENRLKVSDLSLQDYLRLGKDSWANQFCISKILEGRPLLSLERSIDGLEYASIELENVEHVDANAALQIHGNIENAPVSETRKIFFDVNNNRWEVFDLATPDYLHLKNNDYWAQKYCSTRFLGGGEVKYLYRSLDDVKYDRVALIRNNQVPYLNIHAQVRSIPDHLFQHVVADEFYADEE